MAVFYSDTMAKLRNTVPQDLPAASEVHGRLRRFKSVVTFATQTTSDTIEVAKLPKGARVAFILITVDTSTGTSTVALGIAGSTAKYKAAGAVTTTNVPQIFGVAAALGEALTAEEIVIITIGTASLPGSGRMVIEFFYSVD
jgi:hypothetical protein